MSVERARRRAVLAAAVAAVIGGCSGGDDDVVGPFTGEVHRYVVDAVSLPRDATQFAAVAGDLDGDGDVEDQLALLTRLLAVGNDLSVDTADMVASGALGSVVELQADDLTADDSVGVRYLGAEGAPAIAAGGRLEGGAFRSNRAATTRAPGRASVHLPIFTNADPVVVDLDGLELDLAPDGAGGFDAILRGGIVQEAARQAVYLGLVQMLATEPQRHIVFARGNDTDGDGVLSRQEVDSSAIALVVVADIQLFDGTSYAPRPGSHAPDSVSVGCAVHLSPCAAGRCSTTTPVNSCRDRIVDGDETDVDCGGACQACAGDAACGVPADCQSNACDAGHCRAPACSDGVHDGFETDVDCGGVCAPCQTGQACVGDDDCASASCAVDTCT